MRRTARRSGRGEAGEKASGRESHEEDAGRRDAGENAEELHLATTIRGKVALPLRKDGHLNLKSVHTHLRNSNALVAEVEKHLTGFD